ncbi:surfeit locus protein 1 (surf1) [Rickettsia typhi str. B9991CWPP]|uniref:Surfeit locus protein 1 (Surf1) n=1 Tax=Rickettsia typhi str. TH1527 TaxID=1003201 RepID=A0ABM5MVC3_RICTP|nr:surfeit locus protein 1 (surf1) [Rickettsia typhi str. TH1527]AFE55394.1 surfeit locus protein 1 (surf1) [Rickettsia typhi str. B9991CWPP]
MLQMISEMKLSKLLCHLKKHSTTYQLIDIKNNVLLTLDLKEVSKALELNLENFYIIAEEII